MTLQSMIARQPAAKIPTLFSAWGVVDGGMTEVSAPGGHVFTNTLSFGSNTSPGPYGPTGGSLGSNMRRSAPLSVAPLLQPESAADLTSWSFSNWSLETLECSDYGVITANVIVSGTTASVNSYVTWTEFPTVTPTSGSLTTTSLVMQALSSYAQGAPSWRNLHTARTTLPSISVSCDDAAQLQREADSLVDEFLAIPATGTAEADLLQAADAALARRSQRSQESVQSWAAKLGEILARFTD